MERQVAVLLADQIPLTYEMEALKAQAIIARTYLYGKKEAEGEFLFSEERRTFQKAEKAAAETAGQVMTYEGVLIQPLFHSVSSGITRSGAFPYLKGTDSSWDTEAEEYLTVMNWTPEEFVTAFREGMRNMGQEVWVTEREAPDSLQMVEREEGGYVKAFQIGSHVYDGETVQKALGLPSPAYILESPGEKIRAVCKGSGHGFGLSQYGANRLAREGKTAEEILKYYYSDIEIQ